MKSRTFGGRGGEHLLTSRKKASVRSRSVNSMLSMLTRCSSVFLDLMDTFRHLQVTCIFHRSANEVHYFFFLFFERDEKRFFPLCFGNEGCAVRRREHAIESRLGRSFPLEFTLNLRSNRSSFINAENTERCAGNQIKRRPLLVASTRLLLLSTVSLLRRHATNSDEK